MTGEDGISSEDVIFFGIVWGILAAMIFVSTALTNFNIDKKFDELKQDPICESARVALDTVNSQREIRK